MISWTSKIKHDGKILYIQSHLKEEVYDRIMKKNPDVTYFEQEKKSYTSSRFHKIFLSAKIIIINI